MTLNRRNATTLLLVTAGVGWSRLASAQPVSEQGARIADSADGGGPSGGTFFVVQEVNGQPVESDALRRSIQASRGRGVHMLVQPYERTVPSGKVRLTLRGTHAHAAPISQIVTALFRDGAPEVSGVVDVELEPSRFYRVNGAIDGFRREVWLEDSDRRVIPGTVVASKPDPELVKAMEGALYTATNLRYEGDWISDEPLPHRRFVPLGSRIKVTDMARHRANVLIDGRKMRVGLDFARDHISMEQWLRQLMVQEDPRLALATMPQDHRNAIRAGQVAVGMTRDQVRLALGRPRLDTTPRLDASDWLYQVAESEEAFIVFDSGGQLVSVDGSRKARAQLLYQLPASGSPAAPAPGSAVPSQ